MLTRIQFGEDYFARKSVGPNFFERVFRVDDNQFVDLALSGGGCTPLDCVPGIFSVVEKALLDGVCDVDGESPNVSGFVYNPPSRPDGASCRNGIHFGFCTGCFIGPDQGLGGSVELVEGIPAVGFYNVGDVAEDASASNGFVQEREHGFVEVGNGAWGRHKETFLC